MAQISLREGPDQPRPLEQLQALLADAELQNNLPAAGPLTLACGDWSIGVNELRGLQQALADAGLVLQRLVSSAPGTRVAAAALGLAWYAPDPVPSPAGAAPDDGDEPPALRIHQGTLRSGDHLHSEGSLLVLGDVNPGARVEAGGHVLVWGTLRGVAHAGCGGDTSARITALQLRPLQLRIAGAVARGPDELPVAGFAEQAELIDGVIAINPASPQWPLA
jgi:septum site-determining protein MinC